MSWPKRLLVLFAIVFSLLGAYLSTQMLLQHLYGKSSGGLLAAICSTGSGGCDKISSSRWATIPPKPKSENPQVSQTSQGSKGATAKHVRIHIPVPILGLLYFSFLAAWFLGVGCPNQLGRRWQVVPFLAVLAGNCWSIFFMYIMARVVQAWCGGCLAVHAINFALLVIVVTTCPRRWRKTATSVSGTELSVPPSPASLVPHPSTRLALVTLTLASSFVLIGMLIAATVALYILAAERKSVVDEVAQNPEVLVAMYGKREYREVPVSADSPSHGGPTSAPYTVVVFSDMTCSKCKEFEAFLDEQVQPLFGERLRVVFKHYPLSDRCNRYQETRSAHSCNAAYATEAARLQGGDEMFWRVLAEIRAKSDDLSSVDYAALATRLGISPDRFLADMQSPVVKARIEEDVELAHRLVKVEYMPTVFLNGRLVPRVAQDKPGFWKLMSENAIAGGVPAKIPATSTAPSIAHAQP